MGAQTEGRTNFGFQCTDEQKAIAEQLAEASGMVLSEYLRQLVIPALESRKIFERRALTLSPGELAERLAHKREGSAIPFAPGAPAAAPILGQFPSEKSAAR